MGLFQKIKNWLKNNQEKNSERYLEREELKKELKEYSRDINEIIESPLFKINDKPLEKAILIQNLHSQRSLNKVTDSLKTATWILALATIVFAWATIVDSPNSNYIIQTLQNIAGVIAFLLIVGIAIAIIWEGIKLIYRKFQLPYRE